MKDLRTHLCCAIALSMVAVLLAGCGASVPDVKGKTPQQAVQVLSNAGFASVRVTYDDTAQGAAGAVVAQNPVAGSSASQDTSVTILVAGPPPAKVPSIVGLKSGEAKAALSAVGLRMVEAPRTYDSSIPAGTVISQTPGPGGEAAAGSPVDVVVSRGPETVEVPDVVGTTQAAASKSLASAGLGVSVVTKTSAVSRGTVISQSPEAGAEALPGSKVGLTVSRGAPAPTASTPKKYAATMELRVLVNGAWTGYVSVSRGGQIFRAYSGIYSLAAGDPIWIATRSDGSWYVVGPR